MRDETILKNKNCFISGASGSLGESFTRKFAEQGCNLFLTGTSDTKLLKLKKDIEASMNEEIKISLASGDFEKLNEMNRVIDIARNEIGDIDILINSIGIVQFEPFISTTIEDFDKMFNLNVRAPYVLVKNYART